MLLYDFYKMTHVLYFLLRYGKMDISDVDFVFKELKFNWKDDTWEQRKKKGKVKKG